MKSIAAKILSIENDIVNISFPDGQMLRVSREQIDGVPTVGAEVRMGFHTVGSEDAGQSALARALLDEILGA